MDKIREADIDFRYVAAGCSHEGTRSTTHHTCQHRFWTQLVFDGLYSNLITASSSSRFQKFGFMSLVPFGINTHRTSSNQRFRGAGLNGISMPGSNQSNQEASQPCQILLTLSTLSKFISALPMADPLTLGSDPTALRWYRQAELVHARWAMLGVAGILAQEVYRVSGHTCTPHVLWYQILCGATAPEPWLAVQALSGTEAAMSGKA